MGSSHPHVHHYSYYILFDSKTTSVILELNSRSLYMYFFIYTVYAFFFNLLFRSDERHLLSFNHINHSTVLQPAFYCLGMMLGDRAKNKSCSETTVHENPSLNDVAAVFILFRYYTS